jgi:sialic acid synthase SpsE
MFNCPIGFSDHTLGIAASVAAVSRGASVIEKHFTLDKDSKGPDHFYALNPDELIQMIRMIREAHQVLGSHLKTMLPQEKEVGRREGLYLNQHYKLER